MTILQAVLLGGVEGITEFLPISSTAHLLLTQQLLGIPFTRDLASFDIAIQLGAIVAVLLLSGKRLLQSRKMMGLVLAAFIPTAIIGLVLHDMVTTIFFQSTSSMLLALIIGGIVMIVVEKYKKPGSKVELTWKDAVIVGVLQTLAMLPGVSRSGATIIGAMLLGLTRKEAVEFSFLIAIPTMAAATGLDLLKNPSVLTDNPAPLLTGFVVAFLTALFAIQWLRRYVSTHDFTPFGIYRILIGLGLFWVLL